MTRLTQNYLYEGHRPFMKDCQDMDFLQDIADKLGQLEDIEEYLEMDLAVFFKCMAIVYEGEKDDCFIKGNNKLTYGHLIDLDYCKKKVVIRDNNDNEYVYGFASYGKSWELI